jgi:hypothetical protein
MRTLLRKFPAALYFEGPDKWTPNAGDAFNFKSIDHALEFIRRWSLRNVELAFAFDEEEPVTAIAPEKLETKYSLD